MVQGSVTREIWTCTASFAWRSRRNLVRIVSRLILSRCKILVQSGLDRQLMLAPKCTEIGSEISRRCPIRDQIWPPWMLCYFQPADAVSRVDGCRSSFINYLLLGSWYWLMQHVLTLQLYLAVMTRSLLFVSQFVGEGVSLVKVIAFFIGHKSTSVIDTCDCAIFFFIFRY